MRGQVSTIPAPSGGYPGRAVSVAECPDGEVLTGGGANVTAGSSRADLYQLTSSQPISGQKWWAFATNMDSGNSGTLHSYAICAKVISVHTFSN
ncbi:hypothetical protein [Streptomyces boluensis]|uniref:hypothetical protein n=1 Tax=Streptomyces boluensis TaxID=1775135 RepID=UPI001376596A|nr:hypothetical protein [Streptomyces boluensis]